MHAAGPDPWPGGCESGGGDTMNALAANDIEAPRSDRAERRRRLAEPDLEFRAFCTRRRLPASSGRSWSGPGTPTKPNGTGAVRAASGLHTPITRSGHADGHPAWPGDWFVAAVLALLSSWVFLADAGIRGPGSPSRKTSGYG